MPKVEVMRWLECFILCGLTLLGASNFALAQQAAPQNFVAFVDSTARVCPASETDLKPPDKTDAKCTEVQMSDVDPQDKHIWALFDLRISDHMLDSYEPLGIGLSAKTSSFIYINGREVGRNGQPADNHEAERVGRMDVVFPLREGVLRAGNNQIAIRMSSHSGLLSLNSPVHSVYVSPYERPQSRMLRRYAPSLLPFGVFILGALYFLTMSVVGKQRIRAGLLGAMSASAAFQLFAEVSRSLFAYTYPWHDYRLIVILACSALFGICLSAYVVRVFGRIHQWRWFSFIGLTIILAMFIPKGFDAKAGTVLLSQTFLSLGIVLFYRAGGLSKAIAFSTALFIFGVTNVFAQGQFLDMYFFYGVATLMMFLFVQQALAYGKEQALRQTEKIRANKLQLVLDQRQEKTKPVILSLSEAGKIHRVAAENIVFISGADDYIEVMLSSGKTRLISSTLAEIEAQLPSLFLRVHRSHIVNTSFIKGLSREPSGTGCLTLIQGNTIPVSRRIMPSVRKALI